MSAGCLGAVLGSGLIAADEIPCIVTLAGDDAGFADTERFCCQINVLPLER